MSNSATEAFERRHSLDNLTEAEIREEKSTREGEAEEQERPRRRMLAAGRGKPSEVQEQLARKASS